MIHELDTVILTTPLPEYGLEAGDVGTVVLEHRASKGYEVEFVTLDGETVAVASVFPKQIRPVAQREMLHARALAA